MDFGTFLLHADHLRVHPATPTTPPLHRATSWAFAAVAARDPALASHRSLSPERRQALGIGDALMRASVGREHAADIMAEFARALAVALPPE